jgi:hypothetical protein
MSDDRIVRGCALPFPARGGQRIRQQVNCFALNEGVFCGATPLRAAATGVSFQAAKAQVLAARRGWSAGHSSEEQATVGSLRSRHGCGGRNGVTCEGAMALITLLPLQS